MSSDTTAGNDPYKVGDTDASKPKAYEKPPVKMSLGYYDEWTGEYHANIES
jgi:hypothetical protein